jgi:hypothetical protein
METPRGGFAKMDYSLLVREFAVDILYVVEDNIIILIIKGLWGKYNVEVHRNYRPLRPI